MNQEKDAKGQPTQGPRPLVFNLRGFEAVKQGSPEAKEAVDWFLEKVRVLPEMHVESVPATDGTVWKGVLTEDGQVERVENINNFFSVEGRKITRRDTQLGKDKDFSWNQPAIIQGGEELETRTGEKKRVTGLILLITDASDRTLLVVEQEPFVPVVVVDGKERRPVVRSPLQTSIAKLNKLVNGESQYDPNLFAILDIVRKEKTPQEFIEGLNWTTAPTDGNRLNSSVLFGSLTVSDEDATRIQERIPSGKFLTRKQISALSEFGALNGHTLVAMALRDAQGSMPRETAN